MSWKSAQDDAQRWLDRLQLKTTDIRGQVVDLRPHVHLLDAEAQYQAMVFEAAKRILKKRGARGCTFPPDSREQ